MTQSIVSYKSRFGYLFGQIDTAQFSNSFQEFIASCIKTTEVVGLVHCELVCDTQAIIYFNTQEVVVRHNVGDNSWWLNTSLKSVDPGNVKQTINGFLSTVRQVHLGEFIGEEDEVDDEEQPSREDCEI